MIDDLALSQQQLNKHQQVLTQLDMISNNSYMYIAGFGLGGGGLGKDGNSQGRP